MVHNTVKRPFFRIGRVLSHQCAPPPNPTEQTNALVHAAASEVLKSHYAVPVPVAKLDGCTLHIFSALS